MPFVISVAGTVAGTTSYFDSDPFSSGIEIGASFIGTPWWRSNVNSTAKLLMLGNAFEVYGYERVMLKTDTANERSSKAIARLGGIEGRRASPSHEAARRQLARQRYLLDSAR